MKKRMLAVAVCAVAALGLFAIVGCSSQAGNSTTSETVTETTSGSSDKITVYVREDGSGVRHAVDKILKIDHEAADKLASDAKSVVSSTKDVLKAVAEDDSGIGYVSFGALDDTVKAVKIDGVEPTIENVESGSYALTHPFELVAKDSASGVTHDFMTYVMSSDGQKIIEHNGYVPAEKDAPKYKETKQSGSLVIAGSSSMVPLMEQLAGAYHDLHSDVTVEIKTLDSDEGIKMVNDGTCDIAMVSYELDTSELDADVAAQVIAYDGVAVVVNKSIEVDDLTRDQVARIFNGDALNWGEIW